MVRTRRESIGCSFALIGLGLLLLAGCSGVGALAAGLLAFGCATGPGGGDVPWAVQFGSHAEAPGVAFGVGGSLWVTGSVAGPLRPEARYTGGLDAFIVAFASPGVREPAVRAQGAVAGDERPIDLAVTASGPLMAGSVSAAGPPDANGDDVDAALWFADDRGAAVLWWRLSMTGAVTLSSMLVAPDGTIYLAGWGPAQAGLHTLPEGFVLEMDASLTGWRFLASFGTRLGDQVHGLALTADGDLIVVNATPGVLETGGTAAGGLDAFVLRLRGGPGPGQFERVAWVHQFGTSADDVALGVAVAGDGAIVVSGTTRGNLLDPSPPRTGTDVFVAAFGPAGEPLWLRQVGSAADDVGWALALDGSGGLVVVGNTDGELDPLGAAPGRNAFVMQLPP